MGNDTWWIGVANNEGDIHRLLEEHVTGTECESMLLHPVFADTVEAEAIMDFFGHMEIMTSASLEQITETYRSKIMVE
jgi:hypothetical protein